MTDNKNNRTLFDRFSLSGTSGLVGIVAVAILAFSFGAIFFGSDAPPSSSDTAHADSVQTAETEISWTCSMHPQIKLPKAGKCPICFMDMIPLETDTGDELGPRQLRLSESAKELARIGTSPVVRAFAEAEVRMVGKLKYDETKLSSITAWVGGRLDRLYADYTGMTVNEGDHLVYMYSPELLAAQEELLQAKTVIGTLDRSTSVVLKSTADATLKAAREKLRLYGLSNRQIENIESSGEATDHLTINAPIGGIVVHKNAQEGMYVKTGTKIYTIADLTRLWVMFEAFESDLPWLRYGQQVSFTTPSFPGETFEALISFIDPVVDPKTRTVRVRAIVENKTMKLKPEMFVRGVLTSQVDASGNVVDKYMAGKWISPMHPEIVKDRPGQCDVCGMDLVKAESIGYSGRDLSPIDVPLLIPASAPLMTGKRAIVYVEMTSDEGSLFEGREVELGPRAGDFYVAKSGVTEGERVVTNGAFKIDSELQLQAKLSMMSPDGEEDDVKHQHEPVITAEASPESQEALLQLSAVYDTYFEVQMALAMDDFDAAKQAAEQLRKTAEDIDISLFSRSGHGNWMVISGRVMSHASELSESSDIAKARVSFFGLSQAAIDLQNKFGHTDGRDYYLTYCPMAFDNSGAYWLQTVDTVYNSFYGDMMLRCGEIKKELSARPAGEGQ
ncbi:MAG: efflux RND transporter periplasmic adaptor subunit [candidate division Zixibacteria bacterium]